MNAFSQHAMARQIRKAGIFAPAKTFVEIERRIAALPSKKERGDAFEVFAEGYLVTQRIMKAKTVWVNTEIPVKVSKKLNIPRGGAGIDGIYEDTDGRYVPYQVKFREGRPNLTLDELGGFYALSSQAQTKLLFTNSDSVSRHAKSRSGYISVRGSDLDRLTSAEIDAICTWVRHERPRPERRSPRPYQEAALNDIAKGLAQQDRATAVMACGTGKTLVALWAAEHQKPKRVLVLLPSLALLSQTLREWALFTTWGDHFRYLCVCSDPSVSRGGDEWSAAPEELNFRVGTDPKEVRRFLDGKDNAVRVVFSTYQSSRIVAKGMKGLPPFDFGIFDEAHKTAGREGANFGFALKDNNLPICKRLFLTATPRHYDIRRRNQEGDFAVTSMDDPNVYGPTVHKLTFGKAANQGIVCRYKVIISVVDSDTLDREGIRKSKVLVAGKETHANWVATQLALKNAVRRTSAKRIITFHRDVKAARAFAASDAEGIAKYLPNFTINHVNGTQPISDREASMREFREVERGLITNARCLTEGVDVPSVDMVAFMSPRKSRVDIVQAVGRAMRKSKNKKLGYVLIPLFLNRRKGETLQQAFERSDFDEVATVINAMQEQDDELAEIIRELRQQRGEVGGVNESCFKEKIEVIGPTLALKELRSTISARLVEKIGVSWDELYGRLIAYKRTSGNCNVPFNYSDTSLASWVNAQRLLKRAGKLLPTRFSLLERLGFVWDPLLSSWQDFFQQLVAYRRRTGHCNVPRHGNAADKELAGWVHNQRTRYKKKQLEPERIARLEALGFLWNLNEENWEMMFQKLSAYKRDGGDVNAPLQSGDDGLAAWVWRQRKAKKANTLGEKRTARLQGLGVVWDPSSDLWDRNFEKLIEYKRKHGDCKVSKRDSDLGAWASTQRRERKRGKLGADRVARLERIGFDWDPVASKWEEMFGRLADYKRKHGDCDVKFNYDLDPQLFQWVSTQRKERKRDKLDADRVARLERIGFDWDPFASKWEELFSRLVEYKRKHGDCNVSGSYRLDPELASWVANQRTVRRQRDERKRGKLKSDRVARLDRLGFEWDLLAARWEEMLKRLVEYKRKHGDCNVPSRTTSDVELGRWVHSQRHRNSLGKLDPQRAARLTRIGFEWGLKKVRS